jgi:hypothetical protein
MICGILAKYVVSIVNFAFFMFWSEKGNRNCGENFSKSGD